MVLAIADAYTAPAPTPTPIVAAPSTLANLAAPAELAGFLVDGAYRPPADLSMDGWLSHGRVLSRRWAQVLWLLSDWARTGVDYFGPLAWSHLSTVSGRDRDTLRKMVATSRRFPLGRRRLGIPFSRHVAVATLPDEDADRLLARAELEAWTQQDLVRQIRAYRGQPTRPKPKQRARLAAPTATTTTAIVTPDSTDYRQTAPIRCGSCWLSIGYAVGTRAVMSTGPATVQRIASGQLTMNAECTSCKSTTLVSLAALEIPTSAVGGLTAGSI